MRTRIPIHLLLGALVLAYAASAWAGTDLQSPVRVVAGGSPIDCNVGHAAPFAHDWNGDGVWDLLVGQMGQGRLRIYLNTGTRAEPRFEDHIVFKAGAGDGTVPSG